MLNETSTQTPRQHDARFHEMADDLDRTAALSAR